MTPSMSLTPVSAAFPVSAPAHSAPTFVDASSAPRRVAIDVERPEDAQAREALLDRAFGPARFAKTCERLRAGRLAADGLSFVARTGDRCDGDAAGGGDVVGTVRLWHVSAGGTPALMLGPLAVQAEWRCHRLGARLMRAAVARAGALGHGAIVLVGDAPYYARFGFERRLAAGLRMPGPVEDDRFLALELVPGALAGARGAVRATGALDMAEGRQRRTPRLARVA